MTALGQHEIVAFFLSLALLLGTARVLGELFSKYGQPAIVGELLAGILVGPTVFGYIYPEFSAWLLPATGKVPLVLGGFTLLSVALLLLLAGIEVDLPLVLGQGRTALLTSSMGFIVPWVTGFTAALLAPTLFGQSDDSGRKIMFALFFGTALTISAMPVIAKTLMDLNLYRSKIGMIVMASAMIDDLAGWLLFSVILAVWGAQASHGTSVGLIIVLTLGFAGLMLTVGRWMIDRALRWRQQYLGGTGGGLSIALTLACICAAATEAIGIHALFGAFLVGVAIGDSRHLGKQTREAIKMFVLSFFAPIYFASIGLRVNFAAHFDLLLVVTVFALGCVGKILGSGLGAYWGGADKHEALAVGFGMNARGMMQIVFGTLAFQHGLIEERMFVAFVIMAVATSMLGGPGILWSLGRSRPSTEPHAVGKEVAS